MKDVFVIGIDPAPSKKSTVCYLKDGKILFEDFTPYELKDFLDERTEPDILVCWDSPLTGVDVSKKDNSFYSRAIEKKFQQKEEYHYLKETGVSVLGFAGCPHWTVSRYVLGLPKFTEFDKNKIPFRLITKESDINIGGRMVTEVHPAIAIHHWYIESIKGYKTKTSQVGKIFDKISKRWKLTLGIKPKNSDQLDALVAFVLGTLWLKKDGVEIYEHKNSSFLLPEKDWKL